MNYLIFDTEQTYNYGGIVVNEKGEILKRLNLVLTNNFENRSLIGENTYKRKKPIYEKDPDVKFMGSGEGAEFFKKLLNEFKIEQIISHNISEDRRQLELLAQQTGVKFPEIPFYDSINLVKVLFPNNTQTGLEAIVSDITGIDVKQTHTALQDCDLLYNLIYPIIEFMPCFIKYKDVFAHDANYEVTQKFFTSLDKILPFPATFDDIQEKLGMADTGAKRICSNFLKDTTLNLWRVEEYIKFGKTGKPLKTPGMQIVELNTKSTEDVKLIGRLFNTLDVIADTIVAACVKHQASQETDETITARLEKYKTQIAEEYAEKEMQMRAKELAAEAKIAELKKMQQAKEAQMRVKFVENLTPCVSGGLFNSSFKTLKNYVNSKDYMGLWNWLLR